MYCKKCGSEIKDDASICPKCGCSTGYEPKTNNDARSLGIALVCFLIPLLGFIMYLVWFGECPKKSASAGIGALTSIIFWGVAVAIWHIVLFRLL